MSEAVAEVSRQRKLRSLQPVGVTAVGQPWRNAATLGLALHGETKPEKGARQNNGGVPSALPEKGSADVVGGRSAERPPCPTRKARERI